MLTKAEILVRRGSLDELGALIDTHAATFANPSPENHAHLERVIASALACGGDAQAADLHFQRSRRIYSAIGSASGLLDLARTVADSKRDTSRMDNVRTYPPQSPASGAAAATVHDLSTLILHIGRPELAAGTAISILDRAQSVLGAIALRRRGDDVREVIASCGAHEQISRAYANPATAESSPDRYHVITIGSAQDAEFDIIAEPRPDLESTTTVNSLGLLLAALRRLARADIERQESLALWPPDELFTEGQQAIVTGKMKEVMSLAQRVAMTDVTVLITGESGTGKEILARAIHDHSRRARRPFVPLNCTAVPQDLLESQLFGHRRGAFTGADRDQPGLIRAAHEGTLFLDEIGELKLDLQPKLLRFLESGEISPLGEPGPLNANVRIVAATNARLEELVESGRFREDLFYRLNVIRLTIPPLRERRDEIPALAHHFCLQAADEFNKGRIRLADETIEQLVLFSWPGNIRQLHNEVRRMVALAESNGVLRPNALSPAVVRSESSRQKATNGHNGNGQLTLDLHARLAPAVERLEREMIRAALETHKGKVEAAAKTLGISRKGLYLKTFRDWDCDVGERRPRLQR